MVQAWGLAADAMTRLGAGSQTKQVLRFRAINLPDRADNEGRGAEEAGQPMTPSLWETGGDG